MSKVPAPYTTEDTGYPVGTWMPGLFYTSEYIAYCEARDRHTPRVQHGAVRVPQKPVQKRTYPARACAVCGTSFVPTVSRQILCGSHDCDRERARQVTAARHVPVAERPRREPQYRPRQCVVCGATYAPKTPSQTVCGKRECTREYARTRKAAWRLAQRKKEVA